MSVGEYDLKVDQTQPVTEDMVALSMRLKDFVALS